MKRYKEKIYITKVAISSVIFKQTLLIAFANILTIVCWQCFGKCMGDFKKRTGCVVPNSPGSWSVL